MASRRARDRRHRAAALAGVDQGEDLELRDRRHRAAAVARRCSQDPQVT